MSHTVTARLWDHLRHAQWSRALDALDAGATWGRFHDAQGRRTLVGVLDTVPLDVLDVLLERGLPVRHDPQADHRPVVSRWFASASGQARRLSVLDRLLAHGISIDLADRITGTTFLAEACRRGALDEAHALLDRGADPHRACCLVGMEDWIRDPDPDKPWLLRGWSPLHLVARSHQRNAGELAQRLLDLGADPLARTGLPWDEGTARQRWAEASPPTPAERAAGNGWTPLHVAQALGTPALVVLEQQALRAVLTTDEASPGNPAPSCSSARPRL